MRATMGWKGTLSLDYRLDAAGGTTAHDLHEGPLRVLQRLYPEGPKVCHHVLVHPPGGLVGGDELRITARLQEGTHALVTTPGATRFYRSLGPQARQEALLVLEPGAKLEWLPLETIAYSGCQAVNRVEARLSPGAEMIGWDVLALGLPAAGEAFDQGEFLQEILLPGQWREKGRISAADRRLLDSPLGLGGHRVTGTAWFAAGQSLAPAMREQLVEAARAVVSEGGAALPGGVTSPQESLVVVRALAARVEPLMALLVRVRAAWREKAWAMEAEPPRVWRT